MYYFLLDKTSKLIKKEFFLLMQLIRIKVGVSTFKVVRLNYEDANSQTSPPQTWSCGIWTFVVRVLILWRKAAKINLRKNVSFGLVRKHQSVALHISFRWNWVVKMLWAHEHHYDKHWSLHPFVSNLFIFLVKGFKVRKNISGFLKWGDGSLDTKLNLINWE